MKRVSLPQRFAAMLAAGLATSDAVAHSSSAAYTLDAWVLTPLLLSSAWFVVGAARLAKRSRLPVHTRRAWGWFGLGWLVLAGALISPLHAAGERSFAAHMLEHELLMLVAAPLLVLGRPVGVFLWALPHRTRLGLHNWTQGKHYRGVWGAVSSAPVATALQLAALWLWHAPHLFELALRSEGWHIAQHVSFLATALLFWHALLRQPRPGVNVACLFVTALATGALGGLMALSDSPWYDAYALLGMTPYGLTPAEDQQLAGLLMWIPGGAVHAIVALVLVQRLLRDRPVAQSWRSA
jgi:putative membrane protein